MTSGRSTRQSRAEKVAAAQAAAQRSESRRRNAIVGGTVVAVLVVVVVMLALVQAQRGSGSGSVAVPAGTTGTANQTVLVGQDDAPVTVTLYEDFQCPACKGFEQAVGPTLASLVQKGTIEVAYRPIAFLDRASSTRYSSRALNAAACVVDRSPGRFGAFHDLLFTNQPEEGSAGLSDTRLTELATQAGVPGLSTCIADETFDGWVRRVTDQSSKDQVNQTPTVLVDGEPLEDRTPQGLSAAVEVAAAAR